MIRHNGKMKTCLFLIQFSVAVASFDANRDVYNPEPRLILSTTQEIRNISLDGTKSTTVRRTKHSTGVDYLFKRKMIFWAENEEEISRSDSDGNNTFIMIKDGTTQYPQNIAVDWIYNNLYWVDATKNTLEVANFSGEMRQVLIKDDIHRPIGIALVPMDGWMFWTNSDNKTPSIGKAGMDGSNRKILVKESIKLPISLTVDLLGKSVYWHDMGLEAISSCDFNGHNQKQHFHAPDIILSFPYGIAYFDNWVFWACRRTMSVYKYFLQSGNDNYIRIFTADSVDHCPMGMQIYHKSKQPEGENHCLNVGCSHWCLPAPMLNNSSPKFSCICPKNLRLSHDWFTCIREDGEPHIPNLQLETVKKDNEGGQGKLISKKDEQRRKKYNELNRKYEELDRKYIDLNIKHETLIKINDKLNKEKDELMKVAATLQH